MTSTVGALAYSFGPFLCARPKTGIRNGDSVLMAHFIHRVQVRLAFFNSKSELQSSTVCDCKTAPKLARGRARRFRQRYTEVSRLLALARMAASQRGSLICKGHWIVTCLDRRMPGSSPAPARARTYFVQRAALSGSMGGNPSTYLPRFVKVKRPVMGPQTALASVAKCTAV